MRVGHVVQEALFHQDAVQLRDGMLVPSGPAAPGTLFYFFDTFTEPTSNALWQLCFYMKIRYNLNNSRKETVWPESSVLMGASSSVIFREKKVI